MSRLLIVTRPEWVPGYHLAGVDAFAAPDAAAAQTIIARWLADGESGLLAVDETLLNGFDAAFLRRLHAAEQLPLLALPGDPQASSSAGSRRRIAALLRQAVGFHISFKGEG